MRLEPDENVPIYSVACVSKEQWFWAVWSKTLYYQNHDPVKSNPPIASGYTSSKNQALNFAKIAAGPNGYCWLSGMAAQYHREKITKPVEKHERAFPNGFVYADWYPNSSPATGGRLQGVASTSTPYRIIKITPKRVYVDARSFHSENQKKGFWHNYDIDTYFTLDRQELESKGEAWSSAQKEMYYTLPIAQRNLPLTPECIRALGLMMPCSIDDVKDAYRQKAKQTHPDSGGSAEAFLALQENYLEAIDFLENV